ncbi:hypothetical protein [Xenophilus sp.]|uniref:hypothetical protein n=1 Tax=Xenophilus sp. TaxID=1873499 RepID=UPI0037DCFB84
MLAWGVLGFAISLAGTWLARAYALRNALLDHPGERRSHQAATPRGGGIAIVAAMLPLLAWLAWQPGTQARAWMWIGLGLVAVAGIGWRDDHRHVPPPLRLAVHLLAAALLAHALVLLGADLVQASAALVLAVVLVNVWNFMDGIDSLAASQALVAAAAYALFAGGGEVALPGIVLAAACAGFLPFNLPRARIFLGDVGSGSLGYLLATLAGLLLLETPWPRAPLLAFPLLVFGVDASLTLARRIVRGERWWQAHVQHAYQAWVRRGASHGRVAGAYLAASLVAVSLMFIASAYSFAVIIWVVGLSCAVACMAWSRLQQGWTRAGRG